LAQRFDAAAGAAGRRRLSGRPVPVAVVAALLMVALAALTVWYWPIALDEKLFLVYDPGSALKADRLISSGLVPTVDFAYSYGLLTLAAGRVWFGLFGRTPLAYELLTVLCAAVLLAGVARFARALVFDRRAVALLVLLTPWLVMPYYLNQAHAMEAALLVWALALHARGRLGAALAVLTVCLFVKPSMAYVYGLWLVVRLLMAAWGERRSWRAAARGLLPAAVTGGVLALAMLLWFGALPLVHTLLPLQARASYAAADFGFFHAGQGFIRHASLGYYFYHEVGFWILATAALLTAAGGALVVAATAGRVRAGSPGPRRREMLITIALLHVAFVGVFYGYENSWRYYAYLLPLGVVTATTLVHARAVRVAALVLLVGAELVTLGESWAITREAWIYKQRVEAGLWAYREFHADLRAVEALSAGRAALALVNGDFTPYTHLATPPTWFMSPGLQLPRERQALRDELDAARVVVRLNELGKLDPFLEYAPAAGGPPFEVEYAGPYFTVMARTAAAPSAAGAAPSQPQETP
jgi:hypothetical protein